MIADETASAETKACCSALYASDWARLLLGDSFHPGGLALTEQLGRLVDLRPATHVLDVAAGTGASAIFLAERFGCSVVGVDYSIDSARLATERAARSGSADLVSFVSGDAEHLPAATASVDVVVCECAFCTFPDKTAASAEFARVLRPGGVLALADLTRTGPLPGELGTLLAWISCLGDARPVDEYIGYLEAAGFESQLVESHDDALRELVREIRGRLLGAEVLARLGKLPLVVGDIDQAKRLARAAETAIAEGRLGYTLLIARKPSGDTSPGLRV